MPAQIPARSKTRMRKQCVNTSLRPRRVEKILRLAILLPDGVVGLHRNRAERLPVRSYAITKNEIVDAVSKNRKARQDKDCSEESTFQSRCLRVVGDEHSANYKRVLCSNPYGH